MTIFQRSVLLWVGGAVAGAAVARKRKVLGALLGAVIVGGVGDKILENGRDDRLVRYIAGGLRDRTLRDQIYVDYGMTEPR